MTRLNQSSLEAARWDARLRAPDCTESDRAAFAAWRNEPTNAETYDRLQTALQLLRSDHTSASPPRNMRWRRAWVLPLAAAASLTLAFVSMELWQGSDLPGQVYTAPATAPMPLRLADGSMVDMEPGSAMRVHYARGERRVTLLRGSADFIAEPDDERPFVVLAADRRVTASGTSFGIRLAANIVQIDLRKGKARVHCWHGLLPSEIVIHAGQRLDAEIGSDHARTMPLRDVV